MKIKADLLRVRSVPVDDKGQKMEPEAQPAQRILKTDSEVTTRDGKKLGSIPTDIVYETSAGELAQAMRHPCFQCKHFDQKAWFKLFRSWTDPGAPKAMREQLNAIRAALLTTNNAKLADQHVSQEGDMDVEHALSQLGICRVLTEVHNDAIIVHPTGGCPPEICTPTQPDGFYEAKDKDADRLGSQTFDNVMKLATGKPL